MVILLRSCLSRYLKLFAFSGCSCLKVLIVAFRYKEGHTFRHWKDTQHCYSLNLETQRVWDYEGDNYVHRLNHSKDDGKSVVGDPHCMSNDGECGTCGHGEDSEMTGALYGSKVEAVCPFGLRLRFSDKLWWLYYTTYIRRQMTHLLNSNYKPLIS